MNQISSLIWLAISKRIPKDTKIEKNTEKNYISRNALNEV